jgi:hypothetical protein
MSNLNSLDAKIKVKKQTLKKYQRANRKALRLNLPSPVVPYYEIESVQKELTELIRSKNIIQLFYD